MKPLISKMVLSLALLLTACGGGNQRSNQDENSNQDFTLPKRVITPKNTISDPNYVLPPMPDKELNDSTLLGIDSNNNGVRDDVEIWIYNHWKNYIPCKLIPSDYYTNSKGEQEAYSFTLECSKTPIPYHPILAEIQMQYARAAQIIIQDPSRAKETTKLEEKSQDCMFYFRSYAEIFNEPILIDKYMVSNNIIDGDEFRRVQFNTPKRAKAYGQYNFNLSGMLFGGPDKLEDYRKACNFDVDKLLSDYPIENYIFK